jgi:DNA topoisomerase VI subunit A
MQVAPVVAALEASVLRYVADAASASVPLAPHRHRDAFVTMTAHGLLLAGCTATKRDVYYMAKALFGRQANADAAVARVAAAVPCHRNDLNIVAASKSIVAGDLRFATEDGHTVDVGLFGPAGVLVPARPERLTAVQTRAEFILVYVLSAAPSVRRRRRPPA